MSQRPVFAHAAWADPVLDAGSFVPYLGGGGAATRLRRRWQMRAAAAKGAEGAKVIGSVFVAAMEPAAAGQPDHGSLEHPAVSTQPL